MANRDEPRISSTYHFILDCEIAVVWDHVVSLELFHFEGREEREVRVEPVFF